MNMSILFVVGRQMAVESELNPSCNQFLSIARCTVCRWDATVSHLLKYRSFADAPCPSAHCALAAAQCIIIAPDCLWVGVWVCMWVCYRDNSKLRASILTKLGL